MLIYRTIEVLTQTGPHWRADFVLKILTTKTRSLIRSRWPCSVAQVAYIERRIFDCILTASFWIYHIQRVFPIEWTDLKFHGNWNQNYRLILVFAQYLWPQVLPFNPASNDWIVQDIWKRAVYNSQCNSLHVICFLIERIEQLHATRTQTRE